ncbi:MAG: hypothetical protein CMJ19_15860 [Phycisphaeraceae bacterium]|nr:hypothetical protein [Phycisphaeraceae bacterium]
MSITSAPMTDSIDRRMTTWQPRHGISYLWVLNDDCPDHVIDQMVDGFAKHGVSSVCLHPRSGLLIPYGSDDWFDTIKRIIEKCDAKDVDVWLYDEDPFPSGAVGGRITAEYPQLAAHQMISHTADTSNIHEGAFCFPTGKLLWCGIVNEQTDHTRDLTSNVGMIRRKWTILDPWDSRHYYPNLPLYECPRAFTTHEQFAIRMPVLGEHEKLIAIIARPIAGDHEHWEKLPDSLNPRVTQLFLEMTHERYAANVGEEFGKRVTAMFTDEPKIYDPIAWTPGLFESFEQTFGYDLRPRLWHLFDDNAHNAQRSLTRLHYRDWCQQRFADAWLKPVSDWCQRHNLSLVGHMSPEDDPVQQVQCLGNLLPLQKYLTTPGLDLIIPAVGDSDHGMLNISVVGATSIQQQTGAVGVLSEMLACSGRQPDEQTIKRVLYWHTLMGVSIPVVHGAFNSMQAQRAIDAPPDYGPQHAVWEFMLRQGNEIARIQKQIMHARQIAPVAILWPIRSFAMMPNSPMHDVSPLRDRLIEILNTCLDYQVGVHFIDESDLPDVHLQDGQIQLGHASYSHLIIPDALIWKRQTVDCLTHFMAQNVQVLTVADAPQWIDEGDHLAMNTQAIAEKQPLEQMLNTLPRLVHENEPLVDIRCTAWQQGKQTHYLLMNLSKQSREIQVANRKVTLCPDEFASFTLQA